jgi:beta-mannanase
MKTATHCSIIALVLTGFAVAGCSFHPASAGNTTLLGIYFGNQGWAMDQVRQMEHWQAKKNAVLNMFTNWCDRPDAVDNLFKQQLPNIWNNGNVPLITWEPYLCSPGETPEDVEVRAARGEYDAYFQTWSARLKAFLSGPDGRYNTRDDRRAYLRMGHEMNGDWYPWGAAVGGNSPSDFVTLWKRVKGIFDGKGLDATHLQWIWCVNHTDVGPFPLEQYYPGDTYVDWVAIDGFNWGTSQTWSNWQSAAEAYDPAVARLRALTTKPMAFTEFASSSSTTSGLGVAVKAQWITDVFNYVRTKDIRMVAWFNEDKETDWAVFGGRASDSSFDADGTTYQAYSAYKAAVSQARFVASDAKNARLVTDAQFAGR